MELDEIKRLMREQGYKQLDLANALGIATNKVSLSLSGKRRFTVREMDTLRQFLTPGIGSNGPIRTLPIIGMVAAGNWREAIRQTTSSMIAPDPSVPPRAFALKVVGDSMDIFVQDGGTVIVDPDDRQLFPNRFYIARRNGDDATFKQFKADPARLVPCSTNPEYKDIMIGDEAFEIVGRVLWFASRMPH